MNSILNFNRLGLLLKKDLTENYRVIGLTLLTGLVLATIMIFVDYEYDFHYEFFPFVILLGGFIVASIIFNELHTAQQRHIFLTLPASSLEKFVSKLLISSLGFGVVTILLYWLFSIIINAVAFNLLGLEVQAFNPLEENMWLFIKLFFVLQPVFLLGSVYFNQYAFIKTGGGLLALAFGLLAIGYVLFRIVMAPYFDGWSFRPENVVPSPRFEAFMEGSFTTFVKFLFWYVLAPFLWVVAFFKLKEREA